MQRSPISKGKLYTKGKSAFEVSNNLLIQKHNNFQNLKNLKNLKMEMISFTTTRNNVNSKNAAR